VPSFIKQRWNIDGIFCYGFPLKGMGANNRFVNDPAVA
jgi:hypothetical protein